MTLFDEIRKLEELLHTNEVRKDQVKMDALLHSEFVECGRSGKVYTRVEIVNELLGEEELPAVFAHDYSFALLSDSVALITYKTNHIHADGSTHRSTARSSIWVKEQGCWKMRFHQGTPMDQ